LEQYVKDMVGTFASDKRVLAWDLYNEPAKDSLPLVEASFRWAREAGHDQPLTSCVYGGSADPKRLGEISDVISFHDYSGLGATKNVAGRLLALGRPVFCTEWMARTAGSLFQTHLPYFKENKIACWNWGFVVGRTQTHFPWGSPKDAPEPKVWFHDILRVDGTPYDQQEVRTIKVATGKLPPPPPPTLLIATAEKDPVPWHMTEDAPAGGWFKPAFDAAAWKQAPAPFGRQESERKPSTVWASADIWLRREFDMPAGTFTDCALLLHHDDDAEIYINGVLAVKAGSYNAAYEAIDITPEAQAALKPGKNVIAAHCHQTVGGQYIDIGLTGTRSGR
jgi:hypothetical protein